MKLLFRCLLLTSLIQLQACVYLVGGNYSLGGISVPPEVNTFFVNNFDISAPNAPVTIAVDFTEALRNEIRDESRLKDVDVDPDIEFRGAISGFRVSSEAPQRDETVAFNRLTITVRVTYFSNLNDTEIWTKTFSEFQDFGTDENLLDVQDDLIEEIFETITDRVFREAFANW